MNRAQHIQETVRKDRIFQEAVVSTRDIFQNDNSNQFKQLLIDIYQVLMEWSDYGYTVERLIERLNSHENVIGAMLRFDQAKRPAHESVLFYGATFSPSTGMIVIHINPKLRHLTKTQIAPQINALQASLEHEYTHMAQMSRSLDAGYDPSRKNIVQSTHQFGLGKPFSQYQKAMIDAYAAKNIPIRFSRSVSVGVPQRDMTVGSWYMGNPNEIMAWAVEVGSLFDKARTKTSNPQHASYVNSILDQYLRQVLKYLSPEGADTPALQRFKKHIADYLVNHLNYPPHIVSVEISKLFGRVRRTMS